MEPGILLFAVFAGLLALPLVGRVAQRGHGVHSTAPAATDAVMKTMSTPRSP